MKKGFTTVTFREKSVNENIEIAVKNKADGIEWAGDVHVIPGDIEAAIAVKEKCAKADIEIFSYGTYYGFTRGEQDFKKLLDTAVALGAPTIRIWAYKKNPYDITEDEFNSFVKEVQKCADMAYEHKITLAFEYHRGTMTQTKEGALKILEAVNKPNVKMYWQPNPDVTFEEQLAEIELLKSYIITYHVFAWEKGNVRFPLSDFKDKWATYLSKIEDVKLIIEFVKDDSEEMFADDFKTLVELNPIDAKKPNALFLCNGPEIPNVYDYETVLKLDKIVNLQRLLITSDNLDKYKETLAKTEYVYSTWGMLALTEEQIKEYLPRLKAVMYGAGTVQKFARPFLNLGIKVFSSWAANAVPVAEYTVAQTILAMKGYYQNVRRHRHNDKVPGRTFTIAQTGNYSTKMGILGAGMIGKKVLELIAPYEIDVLVYDPFASDEVITKYGARRAELDEIFSECSVVSNHIANLPATVGMIKYEHLSKMKPNATFINTGRNPQIVGEDLLRVLKENPDLTALLDVEEADANNPLHELDNAFLTTHIAGSLCNEVARMGKYMYEETYKMLNNEPVSYEVSLKMLETMA